MRPAMAMKSRTLLGSLVVLALVACGDSQPTAAVCTRPDEGSACSEESSATRIAGQEEAWEVVFRTTVVEEIEYLDGGVQCALTRRTCVTLECGYGRSTAFEPPDGWFLDVGGQPYYWGEGGDTAEDAIQACGEWWLIYG